MLSARWAARLGLASALIVAGGCIAVLAAHAVSNRQVLASQPGEFAPDFELPIAAGDDEPCEEAFRLSQQRGAVVVAYFCSSLCPVSNDYDQRLTELHRQYAGDSRVRFVAIHTGHPSASAADIAARSMAAGQTFVSVIDADRSVARQYSVTCTPTFLVIDAAGEIRYRGAFDDNRNADQATTRYVASAVRQLLSGKPVKRPLTEAFGCPVK